LNPQSFDFLIASYFRLFFPPKQVSCQSVDPYPPLAFYFLDMLMIVTLFSRFDEFSSLVYMRADDGTRSNYFAFGHWAKEMLRFVF